jgi:hypothetical protein
LELGRDGGAEGADEERDEEGFEEIFLEVDLDVLKVGVRGIAGVGRFDEAFCVDLGRGGGLI